MLYENVSLLIKRKEGLSFVLREDMNQGLGEKSANQTNIDIKGEATIISPFL